jgi:hypothetical protein
MTHRKTNKFLLLFLSCLLQFAGVSAQDDDNENLSINARTSFYLNQRWGWDSAYTDRKQNKFYLRNAQLQLRGNAGKDMRFYFGFDIAQIISKGNDPQNPALMNASIAYKGLKAFDLLIGFDKTCYSRNNQVSFFDSPFWQRSEIVGGALFSRRDLGITLHKDFLNKRLSLWGAMYSGLGEAILLGYNAPSGKYEYVARAEYSWPVAVKYKELDETGMVLPVLSAAINGRYSDKSLPVGQNFASGTTGDFGNKVINGEKYTYGADVNMMWEGFSVQAEIHQLRMQLRDSSDALLNGLPNRITKRNDFAGGFFVQGNYFHKKWKTGLSVRYEELNYNDLVAGYFARWGVAACWKPKGTKVMLKAQYFYNLQEETAIDNLNHKEQLRIGMQINLK